MKLTRTGLYEAKIHYTEELIKGYQELVESLDTMIQTPKPESESDVDYKYRIAKLKIERYEAAGALKSQEFNLQELKDKNQQYQFFLESLQKRIEEDWEPTIRKLKNKVSLRTKRGIPTDDLNQCIDRCDQEFESEEERLEHFRAMLDMSISDI